jgi:hypothetical protein
VALHQSISPHTKISGPTNTICNVWFFHQLAIESLQLHVGDKLYTQTKII